LRGCASVLVFACFAGAFPLLAADSGKESCLALFRQGVERYRSKQLDQSLVNLQSAVECDAKNVEFRVALAEAFIEKGDDNRALAALVAALKLQPDNRPALRDAAALYLRHEMNSEAIPVLVKLSELEPKNAEVLTNLGAAYAGTVDFAKAQASFEAALKLDPANASALLGLGHVFIKTEQTDRAIQLLSEAIRIAPTAYEPRFLRGTALNKIGRNQEALADLETALRLGGDDPEIYYRLAQVDRALGRADQSARALAKFSALRSQSNAQEESRREAAELAMQAQRLVKERKLQEAIALLERSRQLDGDTPQTLFRLAGLYYDTQQYDLAAQDIRQAIERAPSEWVYHYLLGLVKRSTNDPAAAKASFETAAHLNPSAAEVFNQLGELAAARGDSQEAVRNFKEATRLNANEPSYEANLERARALTRK
jgi:tetratricopeptide (TPR) repeat protein